MTQTTDRGCKAVKDTWFGRFNTEIEIPEPPEGYEDWIIWNPGDDIPTEEHKLLVHSNSANIFIPTNPNKGCYNHLDGYSEGLAYCVKREPVVENITICGVKVKNTLMDSSTRFYFNNTEYHFKQGKGEYSISFDVVDGEVDCDSVIMRKITHTS